MKRLVGVFLTLTMAITVYAAEPIEGYWKSIDDRTGSSS